jgi:hypothetical protein
MIINSGGRDVVLDRLLVRGQEATWNGATQNVSYLITSSSISNDLSYISSANMNICNVTTMLSLPDPMLYQLQKRYHTAVWQDSDLVHF